MSQYQKTFTERVFHAVSFEIIAITITAPLSAWILGRSIFSNGNRSYCFINISYVIEFILQHDF
ncbi:chlorhexidine efflux transporter [Shigella sp. FC1967]|uniref:chlorhexidine efflux transporter n=1 Tax=Shigella sp. FC1967 TaxID=1898041 RepID=UPI0025712373|nr:chlorhexidine efflux transporter [Shigella sp. FC1967]